MFRRLLIGSVCTAVLTVVSPAAAVSSTATSGSPSRADRIAESPPVKKVVRLYGDGPVALSTGPAAGAAVPRHARRPGCGSGMQYQDPGAGHPYYGTVDGPTGGAARTAHRLHAGCGRLLPAAWERVVHADAIAVPRQGLAATRPALQAGAGDAPMAAAPRGCRGVVVMSTPCALRAPRSGLRLVSFGTELGGVLARGSLRVQRRRAGAGR